MISASSRIRPKHAGKPIESLGQINPLGDAAVSMAAAGRAYVDAIGKYQGEICQFMTKRLSTDLNHGQALAQCKDWSEAVAAQQQWARQAAEDYVDESRKLMQLAAAGAASPFALPNPAD